MIQKKMESFLIQMWFKQDLNHESSKEEHRMSCNISCQKIDYIFAYCQQNIFWLIEVAFLHMC